MSPLRYRSDGLPATNSTRTVFHNEGGKEDRPKVVRFQMRPDPLAGWVISDE
jgi:hypothetical protein